MNIYLIGYRGSGKTTVAQQLAQQVGLGFCSAVPGAVAVELAGSALHLA